MAGGYYGVCIVYYCVTMGSMVPDMYIQCGSGHGFHVQLQFKRARANVHDSSSREFIVFLLTLSAHTPEGLYGSCFVCACICLLPRNLIHISHLYT